MGVAIHNPTCTVPETSYKDLPLLQLHPTRGRLELHLPRPLAPPSPLPRRAVSGCTSGGSNRWYAAHMISTVLTGIFQGSVSVLMFTTTGNFLGAMKSYVRDKDGTMILKLAGGLCVLMFCLEWVVLVLAFRIRYRAFLDGDRCGRDGIRTEEELKNWPWPFQV